MHFIRGKILSFLFKSKVFEVRLRGNIMRLFIETMKMLINVKFDIKNTNERQIKNAKNIIDFGHHNVHK